MGKLALKGRGDRAAPPGQGSGEGPQAGGRCSGSARLPSLCCSAAGGRSGHVPGWGRSAPARPGPAGVPAGGRAGSGAEPGAGLPRFGRPCGAGARVSRAPRAPRPRPHASPPRLENRRPPSDPPAPAARKVTSAGQAARAPRRGDEARACVLPAVRRRLGRGEEAADAGCSPPLPAPLCRRLGGSAELRRGHTPRAGAEKANPVLLSPPSCGGGGHRSTSGQLGCNRLLHPGAGSGSATTPCDSCQ